jgi:hypothetical protein
VSGENSDQDAGIAIVRRALEAPLRQIAENAGVDGSVVAGKIRESADNAFGFNAQTEEYGDMFKFGVIDPAKVVRTALEDAASIAGLLITTEAMVADKPAKEGAAACRRHARHGRHGRHDVSVRFICDFWEGRLRAPFSCAGEGLLRAQTGPLFGAQLGRNQAEGAGRATARPAGLAL